MPVPVSYRGLTLETGFRADLILNDALLDQSEDVFQIEAVLAPLECLLNAPALLLKLYEAVSH